MVVSFFFTLDFSNLGYSYLSKLLAFLFVIIGLVFWLYAIVLLHFKIRYPLLDGFHIFREVPGPISEEIYFYCAEYSMSME